MPCDTSRLNSAQNSAETAEKLGRNVSGMFKKAPEGSRSVQKIEDLARTSGKLLEKTRCGQD